MSQHNTSVDVGGAASPENAPCWSKGWAFPLIPEELELMGEVVREAWLEYCASTNRADTPGRTLPWSELDDWSKDVDRYIAQRLIERWETLTLNDPTIGIERD